MDAKQISFLTPEDSEHKLIVTLEDGSTEEYTQLNKDQYLEKYPDRAADVSAIGWDTNN
jgi:hypothetical protein